LCVPLSSACVSPRSSRSGPAAARGRPR
jgi:hypothetical protein